MTTISKCLECKNFINNKEFGCKAFEVIPQDILFNKVSHDKPIEGQNGKFIYNPNGKRIDNNDIA